MPLNKSQMIPPPRQQAAVLQELIDNRRQVRAREYQRFRKQIVEYEFLENVQKPLINVLKGLFEDPQSWTITKARDGTVTMAKLSWENINPILKQLNRMDKQEAVETIAEISNKLPNALVEQKELAARLAQVYAAKPTGKDVTVTDLNHLGMLSGPGAAGVFPDEPPHPMMTPPAGAAGAAPPPAGLGPKGEPYKKPSGVETFREHERLPRGESIADDIARRFGPAMLGFIGDILRVTPHQANDIVKDAYEAVNQGRIVMGEEAKDYVTSPEGRIYLDAQTRLRQARGGDPIQQQHAEDDMRVFEHAMDLAERFEKDPNVKRDLIEAAERVGSQFGVSSAAHRFGDEQGADWRSATPIPSSESELGTWKSASDVPTSGETEEGSWRTDSSVPTPAGSLSTIGQADPRQMPWGESPDDYFAELQRSRPSTESPRRTSPTSQPPPVSLQTAMATTLAQTPIQPAFNYYGELYPPQYHPVPGRAGAAAAAEAGAAAAAPPPDAPSAPPIIGPPPGLGTLPKRIVEMEASLGPRPEVFHSEEELNKRLADEAEMLFEETLRNSTEHAQQWQKMGFEVTDDMEKTLKEMGGTKKREIEQIVINLKEGNHYWKDTVYDPFSLQFYDPKEVAENIVEYVKIGMKRPKNYSTIQQVAEGTISPDRLKAALPKKQPAGIGPGGAERLLPVEQGFGVKSRKWHPLKLDNNGRLGDIEVSLPHLLEKMELLVKRREGGKVMIRKKNIPIDLVRLLTRRFNPKEQYSDTAKDLYRKIIKLAKVPIGQSFSHKENILGTGLSRVRDPGDAKSILTDLKPDSVMDELMVDLGTWRNGNRSNILRNIISQRADFLLKNNLIDKEEHKMLHDIIFSKAKNLTTEQKQFFNELFS